MTVYEVPNIEHCTVRPLGDPVVVYRINSNEGWYIHLNDGDELAANAWKTAVALSVDFDFSIVQIVAEADLPEGAEIYGIVNPSHPVSDESEDKSTVTE